MNDPKSPRDWLLARHTLAQRQLDGLRREALPATAENISGRELLTRVFRPHRLAWQTLAAVWVALAVLHVVQQSTLPASRRPAVSPDAIAAWLRQSQTHEGLAQITHRP